MRSPVPPVLAFGVCSQEFLASVYRVVYGGCAMAHKKVKGHLSVGLLAAWLACPDLALAQLTLPNVPVPGLTEPGIITAPGVTVTLPSGSTPGVGLIDTSSLLPGLNLPVGSNVLLINLPGISILLPNLLQLASLGNGAVGVVLNQVAPVNQLFSDAARANQMTPVTQLLDSLTSRIPEVVWRDPGAGADARRVCAARCPQSLDVERGRCRPHATTTVRFPFQTSSADAQVSGATLPTRSIEKSTLPGVLWDASQALQGSGAARSTWVSAAVCSSRMSRSGAPRYCATPASRRPARRGSRRGRWGPLRS